jgi:hypothetical protein
MTNTLRNNNSTTDCQQVAHRSSVAEWILSQQQKVERLSFHKRLGISSHCEVHSVHSAPSSYTANKALKPYPLRRENNRVQPSTRYAVTNRSPLFSAFFVLTPLLNLRHLVFGLMPFGSLRAVTLTYTYSIVSYGTAIFYLRLFKPAFQEHKSGVQQELRAFGSSRDECRMRIIIKQALCNLQSPSFGRRIQVYDGVETWSGSVNNKCIQNYGAGTQCYSTSCTTLSTNEDNINTDLTNSSIQNSIKMLHTVSLASVA